MAGERARWEAVHRSRREQLQEEVLDNETPVASASLTGEREGGTHESGDLTCAARMVRDSGGLGGPPESRGLERVLETLRTAEGRLGWPAHERERQQLIRRVAEALEDGTLQEAEGIEAGDEPADGPLEGVDCGVIARPCGRLTVVAGPRKGAKADYERIRRQRGAAGPGLRRLRTVHSQGQVRLALEAGGGDEATPGAWIVRTAPLDEGGRKIAQVLAAQGVVDCIVAGSEGALKRTRVWGHEVAKVVGANPAVRALWEAMQTEKGG